MLVEVWRIFKSQFEVCPGFNRGFQYFLKSTQFLISQNKRDVLFVDNSPPNSLYGCIDPHGWDLRNYPSDVSVDDELTKVPAYHLLCF